MRGHIFICFLPFLLTIALQRILSEIGAKENVLKVIRDVHKVKKTIKLFVKDKAYLVRSELEGLAHKAFRAAGARVPSQGTRASGLGFLRRIKNLVPRLIFNC